jgi:hypothetical protein
VSGGSCARKVECRPLVTLEGRNHLVATRRLPACRPGGRDRADDIRSSVWIRATVTSVSGSSTFRAGAGVAPPSLTGCSGNYQGFSQWASCGHSGIPIRRRSSAHVATRSPSVRCGHRRSAVRLEAARARSSPQCARCAIGLDGAAMCPLDGSLRFCTRRLMLGPLSTVIVSKISIVRLRADQARRPSSTRRSIRLKPNCSPDVAALR